jgi:hypothetical protein
MSFQILACDLNFKSFLETRILRLKSTLARKKRNIQGIKIDSSQLDRELFLLRNSQKSLAQKASSHEQLLAQLEYTIEKSIPTNKKLSDDIKLSKKLLKLINPDSTISKKNNIKLKKLIFKHLYYSFGDDSYMAKRLENKILDLGLNQLLSYRFHPSILEKISDRLYPTLDIDKTLYEFLAMGEQVYRKKYGREFQKIKYKRAIQELFTTSFIAATIIISGVTNYKLGKEMAESENERMKFFDTDEAQKNLNQVDSLNNSNLLNDIRLTLFNELLEKEKEQTGVMPKEGSQRYKQLHKLIYGEPEDSP